MAHGGGGVGGACVCVRVLCALLIILYIYICKDAHVYLLVPQLMVGALFVCFRLLCLVYLLHTLVGTFVVLLRHTYPMERNL